MSGKPSLKAEIYEAVLSDIIQGIYKQNEIITEKQLIAKYGVSKSPIRDALIELCKEGVLISHPRYGYEVVRINEKEILDVVDFRILIETGCFRVYAPTFTPEDIAELKEFTMKECCWNGTDELPALKHWENNTKFHLKLISYSGNDYCYHMVESSTGVLTRAYAQRFWDQRDNRSWNVDVEGHLCIIRCMEEGRFDQAEQALKKDIASFLDIICPNYARTFNL